MSEDTRAAAVNIADDKLVGGTAIGAFIGEEKRKTFRLLSSGALPAGKLGGEWVASKTALRERYKQLTGAVV